MSPPMTSGLTCRVEMLAISEGIGNEMAYWTVGLGEELKLRTLATTLSFLPWLNSDLATAFSMRWIVLLSSSYKHPLRQ